MRTTHAACANDLSAQEVVEVIEYQATDRDGHWRHGRALIVGHGECPLWAGLELITITREDR